MATPPVADHRVRRGDVSRPLAVYALSRLVTLVMAVVGAKAAGAGFVSFLSRWDSDFFLRIVREGYPDQVPEAAGEVARSTIPFFPLYPLLVKFVSWILPVSEGLAGIVTSLALGGACAVLIHRLTSLTAGRAVADRATTLFCFFPGSIVLSVPYSEGLMIVLALGCLLALHQRRWAAAGLCAALATATRITALALVLVCLWEAARAIRRDREWQSLLAPLLAPVGFLAFFALLWAHTGEAFAYMRSQEAWGVGLRLGWPTLKLLVTFLQGPFADPMSSIVALSVIFATAAVIILVRRGWPASLSIYAISILVFSLVSRSDGLRPRDLLTAFPLILAVGSATEGVWFSLLRYLFVGGLAASMLFHNLTIWYQP